MALAGKRGNLDVMLVRHCASRRRSWGGRVGALLGLTQVVALALDVDDVGVVDDAVDEGGGAGATPAQPVSVAAKKPVTR